MKPKLAIYGDSFAKPSGYAQKFYSQGINKLSNKEYEKFEETCWAYNPILKNNYDIDNFAETGGAFYSSYNMFMNDHDKYDKIIFIVTDHTRIDIEYKSKQFCLSGVNNYERDMLWAASQFDNELDKSHIYELFQSAYKHMIYTMHDKLYEAGTARLVKEMQETKPDAIIIPAFFNRYLNDDFFLCFVHDMETKVFKISENYNDFLDLRSAHMTNENNEIFANYVYNRLQGKDIKLSLDMFVKPLPEEKSKYFTSR
jgi:hypothetical protein